MMMFDPYDGGYDPRFEREQARLKSLLSDLEQIRSGVHPKDLAKSGPVLDRWVIAERPSLYLAGLSSGHPILTGTDRLIATSDLWLMSNDQTWARTRSRWYQLGRPRDRSPSA